MSKYRILGLDDDNHSPIFVCEGGFGQYRTFKELIEFLSRPHQFEVEVKMFSIIDKWSDELQKYDEEEVNAMFNALAGTIDYTEDMNAEEIFYMFWESANRNWW